MVAMLCPGIISDQATPLLCKALFECAHTNFRYAGDSAIWLIVKLHAWAHWWSAFVQLSYHYLLSTLCVNGVINYSRPSSAFPCSNWQKAGRSLRTRLIRGHFCEILHHQKIFRRICKVRYCKSFKLKNNYNSQRRLVWRAKNYFGPLGAPCLERHLRIRAQLAPFQWTRQTSQRTHWSMLYQAVVNTSVFEVQVKGSIVEELVVSKVARVRCKISLNRKRPSKNIYDTKGRLRSSEKKSFLS